MPFLAVALVDLAIVAALVGGAWIANRLRFARDRSTFPCRLAAVGAPASSRICPHWLHLKTRAKWQGDVLVVQAGLLYAQTLPLAVRLPIEARIQEEPRGSVHRLGAHPQSLVFERDDAAALKIAVRQCDRTALAGPFLAVAIAGLPAPRRPDRRRRT
jgi:hypothetical protein